jgi:ribose transport system substrate-binding protein
MFKKAVVFLVVSLVLGTVALGATPIKIGFTVWNLQALFFNQQLEGIKKAAADFGVEYVAVDCQNDLTKQISSIEDLVRLGVNAIIVNPVDAFGVLPAIEEAVAAGIPVIAIDQKIKVPPASIFIGVDNYGAGVEIGKFVVEYVKTNMGGRAKIGIVGALNSYIQNLRMAGFLEAIKGEIGIQVVQIVDGQNVLEIAMTAAENLMTANPDLNLVYTTGEPATLGAIAAIEASGLAGRVKLFGWDLHKSVIAAIDKGIALGIVQQDPFMQGYKGVEYALKILKGEAVPEELIIPVVIVTKDNVDQFRGMFK